MKETERRLKELHAQLDRAYHKTLPFMVVEEDGEWFGSNEYNEARETGIRPVPIDKTLYHGTGLTPIVIVPMERRLPQEANDEK